MEQGSKAYTVTRSAYTWTIVAAGAIVVGAGVYSVRLIQYGFSAREQPTSLEAFLVRKARRWAIPAEAKHLKNPMPANAEMLEHGRNHWADHCATCHANNGSGDTELGRNLYPKAPDMRGPETQSLSDGELYYIIRNGVRMTGMPSWGNPQDGDHDDESWMLVQFIRHLPQLTPDEEEVMKRLNPKGPTERKEEQEEDDFLNGKTATQHKYEH
jgi:mono/diheme cytochrome c family protein